MATTLYVVTELDKAKQLRRHNAYKIFNNMAPAYRMDNCNRHTDRLGLGTRRRAYNFVTPSVVGQESDTFYYCAIKDWNSLPDSLKEISNFVSFKNKLKRHMQEAAIARSEDQYIYF